MAYSLGPVCANLNDVDGQKPEHNLGDTTLGNDNYIYIYGRASEAVTGTCTIDPTTYAITDAAGRHTALAAFAVNDYGWVRDDTKFSPLATVV